MAERSKVYTDEHVAAAVSRGLKERGVDVMTTSEAGMLGESDEEHLAFAFREGRIIFTQDDDFLRLHAAGRQHAGIVYARQQKPVGEIILGLMLIVEVLDSEEMNGRLEYL